ncbi:MAG: tetratricopeptide repeat protein [Minisyncoccota bacterium]
MNFSTKQQLIWGTTSFVVVVLIAWGVWSQAAKTPAPVSPASVLDIASSTDSIVSTTTVPTSSAQTGVSIKPFPINASDASVSWNFKGSYAGNDTLTAQANADISHLTSLVGGGKYDDYDLYNGIANDYTSLGNGTLAYQYYNRSIRIHPGKGLAYVNLAHLMEKLGAYHTAADAYAKAVAVEPGMLQYHLARLTYITNQFPKDNARITAALTDASKQFGDNASILAIEAQWLTGQGRYADAIKAWQTVKMLSPGKDTSAIDAEIARLQAKQ